MRRGNGDVLAGARHLISIKYKIIEKRKEKRKEKRRVIGIAEGYK